MNDFLVCFFPTTKCTLRQNSALNIAKHPEFFCAKIKVSKERKRQKKKHFWTENLVLPQCVRSVICEDFLFAISDLLALLFLLRESIDLGDGLNIWLHLWIGGCRKSFSIIFSSNLGKDQKSFFAALKVDLWVFPRVVEVRKHLAPNRYEEGGNTIFLHHNFKIKFRFFRISKYIGWF